MNQHVYFVALALLLLGTTCAFAGDVPVFQKAADARVFTKTNDISVIGVFASNDGDNAHFIKCFKKVAEAWGNGGVAFGIGYDKGNSFTEKFGDPTGPPMVYAQVNFREDGSIRRGKKRRIGFHFSEKGKMSDCVQAVQKFIFSSCIRPVEYFPGEVDSAARTQMALFSSTWPKLLMPYKSLPKEFAENDLADLALQFNGAIHVVVIDLNDVTGNADNLMKNLNIETPKGSEFSFAIFDPTAASGRTVTPYDEKTDPSREDLVEFMRQHLAENPDRKSVV